MLFCRVKRAVSGLLLSPTVAPPANKGNNTGKVYPIAHNVTLLNVDFSSLSDEVKRE